MKKIKETIKNEIILEHPSNVNFKDAHKIVILMAAPLTSLLFITLVILVPLRRYGFAIYLAYGIVWLIISYLFGLAFGVKFDKKAFFGTDNMVKDIPQKLAYSLAMMIAVYIILFIVSEVNYFLLPENIRKITLAEDSQLEGSLFLFILSVIIAAVAEEYFIRYVAYNYLAKDNRGGELNLKFILYTSIAFSLQHIVMASNVQYYFVAYFFNYFLFSAAMCLIYLKTKNFIYPVTIHAFNNISTGWGFAYIIISEKKLLQLVATIGELGSAQLVMLINFSFTFCLICIWMLVQKALIKIAVQ